MKPIFSIGDSHSAFNFNYIPEVKPIGLGPITMFRVGRDKMNFSEQLPGDCIAIFCFGEIDVRTQLAVHTQDNNDTNEDEVIEKLVSNYIDTILLQRKRNIVPVIMGVTPPCRTESGAMYSGPFTGTDEKRARCCKKLTNFLRSYCLKYDLELFDIYDDYSDKDGHLIYELSDKANHIWDTKYFEVIFYKFLEKVKNNE